MTTVDELTEFLDSHGVAHGAISAGYVADARALGGELVALFAMDTDGEFLEAVSAVLQPCPHRLVAGPNHASAKHGDWHLATMPDTSCTDQLRLLAGASLLAVIHALGRDRLRDCSSPHCIGVFVDTSNTGRRRFCIPPHLRQPPQRRPLPRQEGQPTLPDEAALIAPCAGECHPRPSRAQRDTGHCPPCRHVCHTGSPADSSSDPCRPRLVDLPQSATNEWLDALQDADMGREVSVGDGVVAVRDVIAHVIEEYARHAGHAGLLCECVDGRTGQ